MSSLLRLIDLFSGCGGLTEGFMSTRRYRLVGAVESDIFAASTYAANFGEGHVILGDIADWIGMGLPQADVVIGGPPCQGFSNLGSRNSRDPRNALWRRYVDVIVKTQAPVFVVENVDRFMESGQFRSLRRETHRGGRLSDYRLEAGVLNAADFGTPQVRRRAFVIGTHRDLAPLGMPVPTYTEETWLHVRDAFKGLPRRVTVTDLPDCRTEYFGRRVPGPFKYLDIHVTRRFTELSEQRYRHILPGGNRHDLPDELLAPCWREHKTGSFDVMGRLRWSRPSVTIRTEFHKPEKGRYLHPSEHRPLTHLEAARLQGFPDDFLWCGPKLSIARQIGNAVPIPLARAVAEQVVNHLG